jgi:hypothetical protein
MDSFNVFLTFPDKESIENAIWSEADFDSYLLDIKDLIDRADCEQGANLYYDSTETNAFVQTLDTHSDLIGRISKFRSKLLLYLTQRGI